MKSPILLVNSLQGQWLPRPHHGSQHLGTPRWTIQLQLPYCFWHVIYMSVTSKMTSATPEHKIISIIYPTTQVENQILLTMQVSFCSHCEIFCPVILTIHVPAIITRSVILSLPQYLGETTCHWKYFVTITIFFVGHSTNYYVVTLTEMSLACMLFCRMLHTCCARNTCVQDVCYLPKFGRAPYKCQLHASAMTCMLHVCAAF